MGELARRLRCLDCERHSGRVVAVGKCLGDPVSCKPFSNMLRSYLKKQ